MNILCEKGTTLTETLVAMVILLSVLVPLTATWVYFTRTHDNRLYSEAIDVAVKKMETVLANNTYVESVETGELLPSGLKVNTNISHSENWAFIQIQVISGNTGNTLYVLQTVRWLP